MGLPSPACPATRPHPLCTALRAVLRPSPQSALLALGLVALHGPALGQSLELSDLDGTNGFVLKGIDSRNYSGQSVSGAGDVNGDGIDDLIIGVASANPGGRYDAGQSYVVFGRTDGFGAALELSALDGSDGFVLNGIDAYDLSGWSVSGAGDVNGDGIDDLLIGALYARESYLVFGRTRDFGAVLELSGLDGTDGFVLRGIARGDWSGGSVSGAGDVNGDGIDDLLIGAKYAAPGGRSSAGESYVVFGRTAGFGSVLALSALDGADGFVLNGIDAYDNSGRSVSGAGDVNGDGIDDLLIGADEADPGDRSNAGESYVVFGNRPERVCSVPGSAILDNHPIGVTDTLATFGNSLLADLDLEILATHPFVGDLVFELEHTLGTTTSGITLIDRPGVPASAAGCPGDDIDAVLDDEAASPVEDECAATVPTIAGRFIPNQPLSFFDGEAIGGTWTLTAMDRADGQIGTLDQWCLSTWYQPLSPCAAVGLPIHRVLFNGVETCTGESSLRAWDSIVSATASVSFLSPAVTLGPGFRVERGATFTVSLPP